jgi:hypothetical protein
MSKWTSEASRRWNGAWIGGEGPFACLVSYGKGASVTLFKKFSEAEAHKRRLDFLQPKGMRWRSTEILNLKEMREKRTEATTRGRR